MAANKPVKLPATEHTNVEVGEDGVLYIRIVDPVGGPDRRAKLIKHVKNIFQEALPNTTIIVGLDELRFSTITKKQEFKGKLDGQIQS